MSGKILVLGCFVLAAGFFCIAVSVRAEGSLWDLVEDVRNETIKQTAISDADEIKYGARFAREINRTAQLVPLADQRSRRVEAIGRDVAAYRKRQNIPVTIRLQQSNQINAYAVAGGHVWVTTGMLAFVQSNDELAGIIGHELAHIDWKHCQAKIQLHVTVLEATGDGNLAGLANLVANTLDTPYSQRDENVADYYGATMAFLAGYSPARTADFFDRIEARYRTDRGRSKDPDIDRLQNSHPLNRERMKRIRQRADELMRQQ